MLETVLANWWGIIVVVALILLFLVLADRKIAKEMAWQFVQEVEKNARKYGLAAIQDKKDWVKGWYPFLPPTLKVFVSEKLWHKIVEAIYDQLPEADSGGG